MKRRWWTTHPRSVKSSASSSRVAARPRWSRRACARACSSIGPRVYGPWRRKLRAGSPLRAKLEHGFFSPERMVEIFGRCQATLNVNTWRERFDFGLNPRVFEAGACGTPQLVDHKRELDELFTPEQRAGMLIYRSDDDMARLARSLPARAAELRAAARGAAASFQREHSYRAW